MQKAIRNFLRTALILTLFLLVVSTVYLIRLSDGLDPDSMMLAMLLFVFSLVAVIGISLVLRTMKRNANMKTKSIVVLLIVSCISLQSHAQNSDFNRQRASFAAFNIGFNGLIGGVGSLINHRGEKPNFNTFLDGFYKGAIGGAVSHVGLSMTHQISKRQSIALAWPVRMVNALGSSIVQNAAEDRGMLDRLYFNLYFTRLEYHLPEKKFKARLFTSSLYGFLNVGRGARLDLGKSLQTGIFYFESDNDFSIPGRTGRATGQVSAIGMGTSLSGDEFYAIYAEEVAHILQYDRKVGGNPLLLKFDGRLKEKSKFYKSLSRFIYFDLNGPIFFLTYQIENGTNCNFFEQEARNYAFRMFQQCG